MSADEVLVRVRAASAHPDVWHVVSGTPFVLRVMGNGLFFLWSSVGFVASNIVYAVVAVAAIKPLEAITTESSFVGAIGATAMIGLLFVAPFVAAGAGLVGGAAFGVWRTWRKRLGG